MAKFITGNELNLELEKLFEKAEEYLLLMSPYVKLHTRFESALKTKKNLDRLKLIVVFGKNEQNPSKSINSNDLRFFQDFPNVEIRYEKNLHAKYYASEKSAIITSMNLYDYSQNNNIESGILMENSFIKGFSSLDEQAGTYFERVIDQADLLFMKIPNYVDNSFGLGLSTKYSHSTVEVNRLGEVISKSRSLKSTVANGGFCILTGKAIPFNILLPLNDKDYKVWKKTTDPKMKGKYCHFSGEEGVTSFEKPILSKNWGKAKETYKF